MSKKEVSCSRIEHLSDDEIKGALMAYKQLALRADGNPRGTCARSAITIENGKPSFLSTETANYELFLSMLG